MRVRWPELRGYFALVGVALLFFSDLLLSTERVVGAEGMDLSGYFLPIQALAQSELERGNIALWNPYVLGGVPLLGNWQSGIFYPPNWVLFFLPLASAFNWSVALHMALSGCLTFAWCRRNAISRLGALVAGICFMLSGPLTCRIMAGHITQLQAMAWAPLALLSVDGLIRSGHVRWLWAGATAAALQLLAGSPQIFYYCALLSLPYLVLQLPRCSHRWKAVALFVGSYVLAALLVAVEVIPGLAAAEEAWRTASSSREFSGAFSLPPENLITLIVPYLFGDNETIAYHGGQLPWEATIFAGVIPLSLAGLGALRGRCGNRRLLGGLFVLCLLLALGSHTLVFDALRWLPGFDRIRAPARFSGFGLLFLAQLAAQGFDVTRHLLRHPEGLRRTLFPLIGFGTLLAISGTVVRLGATEEDGGSWGWVVRRLFDHREVRLPRQLIEDPAFLAGAARNASHQLWLAAATLALLGGLILLHQRWDPARWAIVGALLAELFLMGLRNRDSTEYPIPYPLPALAQLDPNARALEPRYNYANLSALVGARQVGGYEPFMPRRYAELIQSSLGQDPDRVLSGLQLFGLPPKLAYVLGVQRIVDPDRRQLLPPLNGMPRLQLITNYEVSSGRETITQRLLDPEFNPRASVILEQQPVPKPAAGPGSVSLLSEGTDFMDIHAELAAPAILVLSENYSRYWRVFPLIPPPQAAYQVIPADFALRALPLAAGSHTFRIEYVPPYFAWGIALSSVAVLAWLLLGVHALHEWSRPT